MRPRWLLLAISVVCLLALFPAAAMSQAATVNAGCGTAKIDGHVYQNEWAGAGKVELFGWTKPAEVDIPVALPDVEASNGGPARGQLWVMNDFDKLYLATRISLDGATLHNNWWLGMMHILFTDEPDALDGQWAAPDCDPLPGEGWIWTFEDRMVPYSEDWFMGESQLGVCDTEPLVGVQWDAEPDTSLVFEYAFDLNASELDNVEPGDCFRLGLWVYAVGCERGTGCSDTSGNWVAGDRIWPAGFQYIPTSLGEVCLDPCVVEEEFVPEVGSLMLLGSGLAGLAGYATLRWRTRE